MAMKNSQESSNPTGARTATVKVLYACEGPPPRQRSPGHASSHLQLVENLRLRRLKEWKSPRGLCQAASKQPAPGTVVEQLRRGVSTKNLAGFMKKHCKLQRHSIQGKEAAQENEAEREKPDKTRQRDLEVAALLPLHSKGIEEQPVVAAWEEYSSWDYRPRSPHILKPWGCSCLCPSQLVRRHAWSYSSTLPQLPGFTPIARCIQTSQEHRHACARKSHLTAKDIKVQRCAHSFRDPNSPTTKYCQRSPSRSMQTRKCNGP